MINIFLLNENFNFSIKNYFNKVNEKIVLSNNIINNNIDNYFMNNIKYILYINTNIKYCIKIIKNENINNIKFSEKNYDFLIDSNNKLLIEYIKKFSFPNLKIDNIFMNNNDNLQKWYNYYFKNNLDLMIFINMFQIIQNNPIKYYIGKENNIDAFYEKLKNYFYILFGKYHISFNLIPFYELFLDCIFYKRKSISFIDLYSIFKNDEYINAFINDLYITSKYKNIFFVKNDHLHMILNEYIVFSLLLYYYNNGYINKIYNIIVKNLENKKIYDHIIYDILYMKQLYFTSISNVKILEYISTGYFYNIIDKNNIKNEDYQKINDILYDFDIIDNEIIMYKYEKLLKDFNEIKNFILNKYNLI